MDRQINRKTDSYRWTERYVDGQKNRPRHMERQTGGKTD